VEATNPTKALTTYHKVQASEGTSKNPCKWVNDMLVEKLPPMYLKSESVGSFFLFAFRPLKCRCFDLVHMPHSLIFVQVWLERSSSKDAHRGWLVWEFVYPVQPKGILSRGDKK
jgi:hypothetical protein